MGEAQKIHVAHLGEEQVVAELVKITAQHVLLLEPHRIRPHQPQFPAVQEEAPSRLGAGVKLERPHPEDPAARIQDRLPVPQGHLQGIEPRRLRFPEARLRDLRKNAVKVRPPSHGISPGVWPPPLRLA